MAHFVECLFSMHEALGSIPPAPHTTKYGGTYPQSQHSGERQECEAVLNYASRLRSAWDTGDPVSKNKQTKPSEVGILRIVWKRSTYCLNIETRHSR